ncbi:phage-associated protein, HI1409 family [Sebaldella termitidis]|uniref:Anti-CBASS protein Acb1-like N-terminal domain-containing protein n=1 Tax=Sebaldella termitidis (strain ATCC 33386 / NCTC 11300) TaxID=526218 RepID=D1AN80_SEBTE|nr:anti-CBASS Acb1 family protein [Sebaldella termitidis]ACZ09684.1 conserved hypothetical protein [Sebaldella termitidis ATCC 33386]SUI25016.1 phage-associated protein, HI1409 family [Sebaldella termitidis]
MLKFFKGIGRGKSQEKMNMMESSSANSTKGTERDVLNKQTPVKKVLDDSEINTIISSNQLAVNIIDAPIDDMLKNDFDLKFYDSSGNENQDVYDKVWEQLNKLDFISKLKYMLKASRKYGYSALVYAVTEDIEKNISEPLGESFDIYNLAIYEKPEIASIKLNQGKYEKKSEIKELTIAEYDDDTKMQIRTIVNPTRAYLARTNEYIGKIGESILTRLWDQLVITDTVEWSIGQIIYRANLLIYSTDKANAKDIEKNGGIATKEQEFNASSLVVKGTDDKLEVLNTSLGFDPEKFINTAGTILSIHTNIPKQRLIGNTAGAISGAEEDGKKYAEFLQRLFNDEAKPVINDIVGKILKSLRKDNLYFEVLLPSLIEIDDKEKAETESARTKSYQDKLGLINGAIDLMARVGLKPKSDKVKKLISTLEFNKDITGQDLAELYIDADEFSKMDLDLEKQKAEIRKINTDSLTIFLNAYTTAQESNSLDEFTDIVKKLGDENNNFTFDDVISMLGGR